MEHLHFSGITEIEDGLLTGCIKDLHLNNMPLGKTLKGAFQASSEISVQRLYVKADVCSMYISSGIQWQQILC